MGRGAGPAIEFRRFDHEGTARVLLDIAQGHPVVALGQRTGEKVLLPQMAGAMAPGVQVLRAALSPPK
jgi:hypothetical protein